MAFRFRDSEKLKELPRDQKQYRQFIAVESSGKDTDNDSYNVYYHIENITQIYFHAPAASGYTRAAQESISA